MTKKKRGNYAITMPILTVIALVVVVIIGMYILNIIQPFIWHEKLNMISHKYMFIIEKYGYLTNTEKSNLINELKDAGFDISKIQIEAPSEIKIYGEYISFNICYEYVLNIPSFGGEKENKKIDIRVNKGSYSKR